MPIESSAVKLKASFYTITVLQLCEYNLALLETQLQQWVTQTPQLFQGMPVIIGLPIKQQTTCDLIAITTCIRRYGLVPIGIQTEHSAQHETARQLNLAVFTAPQKRTLSQRSAGITNEDNGNKTSALSGPTMIESVRSGQQIHVKGDLIVLRSVSPGAEVSAEGHIHIYGTLAGRALAGTDDNKKACIFCNHIKAELIAIAGCYWQHEDLQKSPYKTNVHIYLENESLHISPLG